MKVETAREADPSVTDVRFFGGGGGSRTHDAADMSRVL